MAMEVFEGVIVDSRQPPPLFGPVMVWAKDHEHAKAMVGFLVSQRVKHGLVGPVPSVDDPSIEVLVRRWRRD